jgi:SAM-dependent methyltransferase
VPLGFVTEGHRLYLAAREAAARWPIDILRAGHASAALPGGTEVHGRVRLVTEPEERGRVLARFRSRYGPESFLRWYDHPARVLCVDPDVNPGSQTRDAYDEWIESEFDSIAAEYDHHILGNPVNRLLRDRSLEWLRSVFATSRSLLEIGCGSGIETLSLLGDGHEVTAVDVSTRMLDVVRRKARDAGAAERLRVVHLRARDIAQLTKQTGATTFDGAYSTYGALNCEPDLRPVVEGVGQLLPPGRVFVAGVYNRWCAFETAAYAVTLQFGRSVGRWRNPVRVGTSRFCVDVYAFSAPEFRRLWAPEFSLVRVEGVPVVVPPSDLSPYVQKLSRHFEGWARWDRLLGRRWPLNYLGDHFLMTLVRRSGR